jgi:Ser/Thr protein kinase RdoA (MazF antagonist)
MDHPPALALTPPTDPQQAPAGRPALAEIELSVRQAGWLSCLMLTEESVRRCLAQEWGLPRATLTRLDGGMGSRTWIVDDAGRRWVLKAVVPAMGEALAGGLAVARRLDQAGIPSGAPEPTSSGELTAATGGYRCGLLSWVPGDPLTGKDSGQRRLIGTTLARVHQTLSGLAVPATQRFHWVDPKAGHLSLRPAVAAAVAALEHAGLPT